MSESDLPFPPTRPDPDAEADMSLRDLETVCTYCGMEHQHESTKRDCHCPRHIDAPTEWIPCNAAAPEEPTNHE